MVDNRQPKTGRRRGTRLSADPAARRRWNLALLPEEKRSCGSCVRRLLRLDCNTRLGKIERKLKMAQAYVAAAPGKRLPAA